MKPLEPRGPIEIWHITDKNPEGCPIVGYSFHDSRKMWIHSRQPAIEIVDTFYHEQNHLENPGCNEREVLAFTEADIAVMGIAEVAHVLEILEQAKGWWRIRRKMGRYAKECWGLEI